MKTNMSAPGVSYLRNTWRFIHVSYTFHMRFIPDDTHRQRFIHVSYLTVDRFICVSYLAFIRVLYMFHICFICVSYPWKHVANFLSLLLRLLLRLLLLLSQRAGGYETMHPHAYPQPARNKHERFIL